jgi:hypothetical protein
VSKWKILDHCRYHHWHQELQGHRAVLGHNAKPGTPPCWCTGKEMHHFWSFLRAILLILMDSLSLSLFSYLELYAGVFKSMFNLKKKKIKSVFFNDFNVLM